MPYLYYTNMQTIKKGKNMKIAITTDKKDIQADVELRFGRATGFLIYDTETEEIDFVDNTQQLNAAQGAGIQAAQNVVNSGAEVLISGHCGPKAMRVLKAKKVAVYLSEKDSVAGAIAKFKANELEQIDEADVEEHWV